MRLTVSDLENLGYEVVLDGRVLEDCVEADEERGTALVRERHWRTGELIPDPGSVHGCRVLALRGKVEIVEAFKEGPTPAPTDQDAPPADWHDALGVFAVPLMLGDMRLIPPEAQVGDVWAREAIVDLSGHENYLAGQPSKVSELKQDDLLRILHWVDAFERSKQEQGQCPR